MLFGGVHLRRQKVLWEDIISGKTFVAKKYGHGPAPGAKVRVVCALENVSVNVQKVADVVSAVNKYRCLDAEIRGGVASIVLNITKRSSFLKL